MLETPQKSTPKRKRGEETTLSPIKFSFELSVPPPSSDDGNSSPRSNVAHKFRGLALEGGGGAASDDSDIAESMRKRQRPDEVMRDVDGSEPVRSDIVEHKEDRPVIVAVPLPEPEVALGEAKISLTQAAPQLDPAGLQRSYPSINRLTDSKSRVKKRSGSPPLRLKRAPRRDHDDDDEEMEIFDPVRAALTWHEDEITIYDPEDEDDDGTGLNGIGFKPTTALAASRAMKRRQQMAEYRKREESDARAKRSQRRRGADITIEPEQKSPTRKVRFTDGDNPAEAPVAVTAGFDW
ncbi:Fc.00g016400.m01.CDS01 [Cosmosporella sp. VM-42]